jgi:hypothetical protein
MAQLVIQPIPSPDASLSANASQAAVGAPVTPLQRLQIMSPSDWEEFVLEWVDSLRSVYVDVQRCGGKGDMGRDVIAFKAPIGPAAPWDNYQCKHYAKGLSVADAVGELGKLIYYASLGEFPLPDAYFFVAPRGPSTELLKCLQKGTLKKELLARWDKECRLKITEKNPVELSTVQAAIDSFDFSKVSVLSPLQVIEGHQKTKYYTFRFGGGLPNRTLPVPKPPDDFQANETVYIKKLLDAYGEEKKTSFATIDGLENGAPKLGKHLRRSREQFFSAESLRSFSRDSVPKGTFETLQDEIHDGVQEVYDEEHTSGYQRVVKTVEKARDIAITGNPLIGVMRTNDRAGICHQLANDDRLTWVHAQGGSDSKSEDDKK